MFRRRHPSSDNSARPSLSQQQEVSQYKDENEYSSVVQPKPIKIVFESTVSCIALLANGHQFLSGDKHGTIRRWRMEDGVEVAAAMDAKSAVRCLVASQDGKLIAAGTESRVFVWDVESWEKSIEITHKKGANSVDISSDRSKIAIATADDRAVSIYSLVDGKWLCGGIEMNFHTVKFSPDGSYFACGAGTRKSSFYICNSQNGNRLSKIQVPTRSVAWASDCKKLFALSSDGNIHHVDVSNGTTLSQWPIHSTDNPTRISLSRNGKFIAACANSSISFWDTSTHEQIGFVIHHPHAVNSVAISKNYDLVLAGNSTIALWDLSNVLSAPYINNQSTISVKGTESPVRATINELFTQLAISQRAAIEKEADLQNTINSLRVDLVAQNTRSTNLEKTVEELQTKLTEHGEERNNLQIVVQLLRTQLSDSQQSAEILSMQLSDSQRKDGDKITSLETTIQQLRTQLSDSRQIATELANSKLVIRAHRQKHLCETLYAYADGRVIDAAKSLLDLTRCMTDDVKPDEIVMDWLSVFTTKCVAALEKIGDEASQIRQDDEALAAYAVALSLSPSCPDIFLNKWVTTMLLHGSTKEIMSGAHEFKLHKFDVYRTTCDALEGDCRVTEAVECFLEMRVELAQDNDPGGQRAEWELDFERRCTERLKTLADSAFGAKNYNDAERHYSTMLSYSTILFLDPQDCTDLLIKRSHTRAMTKSWEDALQDADQAIRADPSSYKGYECRHAALHGAGRHAEAVSAFDTMLLKLQESPDPRVRGLRSQYRDARPIIRSIIRATTPHIPRVLIDTPTGRLCDRTQQAETFETLPIFNKLVSSMTREIDNSWIRREVSDFCRYVMFSHKWEHDEPLFQKVVHATVYKLEASRGSIKLQTFCSIVRALGFRWAWSDTCCIDKSDNVVLQESLVAMFAWYRGSSLTIIHLLGVSSLSEVLEALRESIWNSRVWTYQEYVAAKRVLFYTEDWKPYLGLTLENHKESPFILREMEMSEVSSEQVAVLRPGLDRIREKLYLASTRETTLVEDVAYSLLGILNASIPIIYGEGTRAVGRLLEYVLTGSGDATILAWTGVANEYNSCLPLNLTVYNPLIPPHIPHMGIAELDRAVSQLRSSLPDVSLAVTLYHELDKLPSPTVASSRLRLSGIVSPVSDVSMLGLTYRATTNLFGDMEIETASDLASMHGLCLVHPWIHPLLDQEFRCGSTQLDLTTQALRLIARLQQPFGALFFEQVSRTEYKRVAADRLIMVQFSKDVSLTSLMNNIRTIEVL